MTLTNLKKDLLQSFRANLDQAIAGIEGSGASHDHKAKEVNSAISAYRTTLLAGINSMFPDAKAKQQAFIVLQYCTSVVSLEYRHRVWPYEYMALSRRVGELWERFCSTAWDYPSRSGVNKIQAPSFGEIKKRMEDQITHRISDPHTRKELEADIAILFDLVGEINMKEDVVFTIDGLPHIIDFKSGFGSNEKGNMLRLQTVGKAYRLWNLNTKLLFLVRQEENNNYLSVIKRSKLWDVHCGSDAYRMIDELTGSNMMAIRSDVIDFQSDLSKKCWSDLSSHLSDLTSYLHW